jgi:hypothetical protein
MGDDCDAIPKITGVSVVVLTGGNKKFSTEPFGAGDDDSLLAIVADEEAAFGPVLP